MKKIFFIACMSLIACNSMGQSAEKTDYLQKSKSQKTIAWLLFGAGAVVNIIGVASVESPNNTPVVCFIVGSAIMLSSIPFTVMGHQNKKRAAALSINTEQMYQLKNSNLHVVSYPALTMKINLGK